MKKTSSRIVTLVITASTMPYDGVVAVHDAVPPSMDSEGTDAEYYRYECEQFVQALQTRWSAHPEVECFRQVKVRLNSRVAIVGTAKEVGLNSNTGAIQLEIEVDRIYGGSYVSKLDARTSSGRVSFVPKLAEWALAKTKTAA